MNQEHVDLLKTGIIEWNNWRFENLAITPNLRGAHLWKANLREANLQGADLREATLRGADLLGANLRGTNLRVADLREADLREANLRGADLREANLQGADLREADLWRAIGDGEIIKSFQAEYYHCNFLKDILWIGCCKYTYAEWDNFTDEEIINMDHNALCFSQKYKAIILQIKETYGF